MGWGAVLEVGAGLAETAVWLLPALPRGRAARPGPSAVRGAEGPRGPRSPEQLCLREQSRGAGQETGTLTAERLPEAVSAVM